MNRKSATRLLLVQWSKFQNVSVKLEGSTLLQESTEAENPRFWMP
ncbi:MAG: hypothetical protein ACLR2E_20575 [Lachnospiraceae bacterium]